AEVGAGGPDHVLGLWRREAERDELALLGGGDPPAGREREGAAGRLAEAGDQPRADREGREERDLLRGDRGDEALERVGRERRAGAGGTPRRGAHPRPPHGPRGGPRGAPPRAAREVETG